jgi:MFS transporter, OFA family, oxalate/formate antiporter
VSPRPEAAWSVVVASALGLATGIATTIVATFGIFSSALTAEFGWAQGDVFAALMVVTVVAALLAPLAGAWIDRFGARRLILASFAAEALIFASFYWQDDSLVGFYLRYAALAFLGLGTTHVAFARLITLWFESRRGLALGIALSGVGIGGFLWPLGLQWVIQASGWRMAYLVMALVVVVVALPTMWALVREPVRSVVTSDIATVLPGVTLGEARQQPVFWRMVLAFFLVGFSIQSLLVHVVPLLRMRELDASYAALAQSLMFVAVTSGRLVTGWLMDRIFAPKVAASFVILAIAGLVLMAAGTSGVTVLIGALLVGLAVGAEVDVLAYLTGRYFGARCFSQIYGVYYGVYSLSGGAGPWLTALTVDRTGAYDAALALHAVVLAVGAVMLWGMPAFKGAIETPLASKPV